MLLYQSTALHAACSSDQSWTVWQCLCAGNAACPVTCSCSHVSDMPCSRTACQRHRRGAALLLAHRQASRLQSVPHTQDSSTPGPQLNWLVHTSTPGMTGLGHCGNTSPETQGKLPDLARAAAWIVRDWPCSRTACGWQRNRAAHSKQLCFRSTQKVCDCRACPSSRTPARRDCTLIDSC